MKTLYLASQSPQRKKILAGILRPYNIPFKTVSHDFQEYYSGGTPINIAVKNANGKAASVTRKLDAGSVIIASDTVVYIDSEILGKPKTKKYARRCLQMLSGKRHYVITAICVIDNTSMSACCAYEETAVTFHPILSDDLEKYINTNEPYDKAGGYGIQGTGRLFVKEIEGSCSNVIGLPIGLLLRLLNETGLLSACS